MTGKIWGIWRQAPNTGTDSFITHNIRNISGKPGRTGSLRMILLQLDTTDDFKFEKFRIDKDSATCRRDCERIALFLVCLSMSPERPVRGDMAEEDDDPDRATQFCVNTRSTSAAVISMGKIPRRGVSNPGTERSSSRTRRPCANNLNFELCSISMDNFNDKKVLCYDEAQ